MSGTLQPNQAVPATGLGRGALSLRGPASSKAAYAIPKPRARCDTHCSNGASSAHGTSRRSSRRGLKRCTVQLLVQAHLGSPYVFMAHHGSLSNHGSLADGMVGQ